MLASFALLLALAPAASATPSSAPCTDVTTPFVGAICAPGTAGKHPAIVVLGGSEGGDATAKIAAAQFARRGYVAVAVAYFGIDGLPKTLQNVPIEPVGKAVDAAAARADVDPNAIAIFGVSKGGELALLAASVYPKIHAVVAVVPSPFAWEGIAAGPGAAASSWSYGGAPLPYVAYGTAMGQVFSDAFVAHKPLDLRAGYDGAMTEHAAQIPAAMFHLEKIAGPVLFLAAGDDQIWNSVKQSTIGMAYLKAHDHPYDDRMLEYPGAGHLFLFSSAARPLTQAPFSGGITLEVGGTAAGNVAAAQAAWPQIIAFLSKALTGK